MPRVKPLGREDPLRVQIRSEIHGVMGALRMSQGQLAGKIGISQQTLSNRVGKGGNIGSLRLDEYIAIKRLAEKNGVKTKGE